MRNKFLIILSNDAIIHAHMKEIRNVDGSTFEMTREERQKLANVTPIPFCLAEEVVGGGFIINLPNDNLGNFLSSRIREKSDEVGIVIEQQNVE